MTNRGWFLKYSVQKLEGPTDPNADYFVMRLDKDPAARIAALAYADACEETNTQLATDLRRRVAGYNARHIPGTTKAWVITLHGANGIWCDDVYGTTSGLESGTSDTPGLIGVEMPKRLAAMNEGDTIEVGEFVVTCHMVDKTWLDNLGEHMGW